MPWVSGRAAHVRFPAQGKGPPEPLDLARGVSNWDAQELIALTLRKLRRILKNPLGPEWLQGEGLKVVHLRGN